MSVLIVLDITVTGITEYQPKPLTANREVRGGITEHTES